MQLQQRLYEILEVADPADRASRAFHAFILSLIALNIGVLIAETVEPIYRAAPAFFWWFEVISVAIFTIEYVLRVWSVSASPASTGPISSRLRFMLTPMALIDLLAILPFYLQLHADLRAIRALRLLRLFRVQDWAGTAKRCGHCAKLYL